MTVYLFSMIAEHRQRTGHSDGQTTVPLSDAAAQASQPNKIEPELFRLPKSAFTDPYFGALRSFWNERILPCDANGFKPEIRSIVIRRKGATRGRRFIVFESARKYFRKLELEQNGQTEEQIHED